MNVVSVLAYSFGYSASKKASLKRDTASSTAIELAKLRCKYVEAIEAIVVEEKLTILFATFALLSEFLPCPIYMTSAFPKANPLSSFELYLLSPGFRWYFKFWLSVPATY